MPPARNPEQIMAAAAAKLAAKAADAEFAELYKILMKEKNVGFDRAAAIIGRLSVERLNQPHKTGVTVLSKAMSPKSIRIVEALLQKGVSVIKAAPGVNSTYLYEAACQTPEMVRLFLNRGIDINIGARPPLVGAAGNKKFGVEIATILLDNGADINRMSINGSNALMTACYDGNKKMVEFLLARGADVNVRGPGNQTILFSASRGKTKTYIDIFKLLLTKGVDINAVDANGKNVLAAHFDTIPNLDFVKLVAARGVRLDIVDAQGDNLLHKCLSWARLVYKPDDMKPCFDTARFLIANGVNINARNNDRQTPLLGALVNRTYTGMRLSLEFVKAALTLPGIDVNLDGKGWVARAEMAEMVKTSPLNAVAYFSDYESVKKILEAGGDINFHDSQGKTVLMYMVGDKRLPIEILNFLLDRPDVDINITNPTNGLSLLHYAVGDRKINQLNKLIERGANVNATDQHGFTPVFHAAFHGDLVTLDALLKLPAVNKNLLYDGRANINGKTLLDLASIGTRFTKAGVNEKILELCSGPQDLWQGWSRANAAQFDSIFAEDRKESRDSSCCPVCLKTVVRTDGCVYMQGHNCSRLEGFYHKRLYELYKSPENGVITWCTICGRICHGHRHYALGPTTGAKPELIIGRDPFTLDCKATEGGGGELEKLARYRRMREYALELQDDIGKKTQKVALEELVEEMWNAPMVRKGILPKMLAKREWNIPASAFPLPPANAPAAEVDMATLPDIRIPDADRDVVVPNVLQGTDTIMGEDGEVIQFHHRQTGGPAAGGLFHHENNFISAESLAMWINGQNDKYKTDESFGLCWSYPGMCNGRLYPEEIERFFVDPDNAELDAELKAVFADYKKKFNWKFRVRAGGKRKPVTRKAKSNHKHGKSCRHSKIVTRKALRKTKRGGGEPKNVFVPATNAQCNLPPKKKNNTKKNANRV